MNFDVAPRALTRKEAAKLLGISVRTLDRAIARGDLKAKRYGTRLLILLSEVERFLSSLPDQPLGRSASGNH